MHEHSLLQFSISIISYWVSGSYTISYTNTELRAQNNGGRRSACLIVQVENFDEWLVIYLHKPSYSSLLG